jgi:hypothetical protein
MAPTHYGHRPRPNRSRHGATQPPVAIPPRPRYAPDAGGQDGGGGGRIPLGPGRLPEARRSEPRCRRVPRRPGVDQTPWESCCPTGASRRRRRLPAQALREGEALLSARNKLSRHRTTAIKDVEKGSQTSPGGVVSAAHWRPAWGALECGGLTPLSTPSRAGASSRTPQRAEVGEPGRTLFCHTSATPKLARRVGIRDPATSVRTTASFSDLFTCTRPLLSIKSMSAVFTFLIDPISRATER